MRFAARTRETASGTEQRAWPLRPVACSLTRKRIDDQFSPAADLLGPFEQNLVADGRMPLGNFLDERFPPGGCLNRAVRILSVRQPLHCRVAGDIGENEFAGVAEDFFDDPRKIVFRTMFEHVGRNDAVELSFRQPAVRREAGVVAGNRVERPKTPGLKQTLVHRRVARGRADIADLCPSRSRGSSGPHARRSAI